jgi:hypothetical protein
MDAMIIYVCFVSSKLLRVTYCFVITTIVGGANVQHHCYTCGRDQNVSPPNHLVSQHRLNDCQRRIVVQGDNVHDLCAGGS